MRLVPKKLRQNVESKTALPTKTEQKTVESIVKTDQRKRSDVRQSLESLYGFGQRKSFGGFVQRGRKQAKF